MLAGNVTARIVHGNLIIKGDRNDNEIAITQLGTTITVAGTDTTVNSDAAHAVLTDFTGSIKLKMKRGNDSVTLTGVTATKLRANLGKGNDKLDIEHSTINGDTDVDGRSGDDEILVDTVASTETHFNGSLDIDLGRGNDTLRMVKANVTGKADIDGSRGTDQVDITGSSFTTLDTNLGRGDDSLSITDTTASVKIKLNGGKGTNTFTSTGNMFTGLTQKNFT